MNVEYSMIEIACKQGLAIVLSLGIFSLCVWLVKYIVQRLTQAIDGVVESNKELLRSISKHDEKADERGRYVREEHKEMIAIIGRINGYKKDGG